MSEYIVELDSKHSIALKIAFAEEMRGGDFVRGEIVRCRDCKHANANCSVCYREGDIGDDLYYPLIDPDGFCAWGERRKS